jgi:hypothetical protein
MTDLNVEQNDLDLEFKDVVKDPNDPQMRQIAEIIPEKYKGKSVDDLINMHVNLEKVLARQGNEVGQLRKIVDSQTSVLNNITVGSQQTVKTREPVTAETLLSDPTAAVSQVVEPQITAQNARVADLEREVKLGKFESANPTFKNDINDAEFQNWVLASPHRSKLLVALHNYNFDAGNDLWESWREHKGATTAAEDARRARVNAVSTVRTGATEPVGKPTYSRAKLNDLHMRAMNGDRSAKAKWEDPAFQAERLAAYAEQRIK